MEVEFVLIVEVEAQRVDRRAFAQCKMNVVKSISGSSEVRRVGEAELFSVFIVSQFPFISL